MTDRRWTLRPARDLGMAPGERMRSLHREPGLGSALIAIGWRWLTLAYLKSVHRLRVQGYEHLPPPPFVMVCNHTSHLDALTLAAALPTHLASRAFALAAGDTFFTTHATAAFAAYAVNALPIWRRKTSAQDLQALRERLQGDQAVLIMFPEGTRSRSGEMGLFKSGIGALVAGTHVPVVPCYLQGAFEAWPAGRRTPRMGKLMLKIGGPLEFADIAADRAGMTEVARRCEDAVQALRTP